jgi:TetR/AcrR family transcriptional regulator, transcriptional repressor for nem operon
MRMTKAVVIVAAAGHRLKRDGIDGSGVATLMKDAG